MISSTEKDFCKKEAKEIRVYHMLLKKNESGTGMENLFQQYPLLWE